MNSSISSWGYLRAGCVIALARAAVKLVHKARLFYFFQNACVHDGRWLDTTRIGMGQGIKDALNPVRFWHRKFAHALERALVDVLLDGRILDIFLVEGPVDCFRSRSEDIDAFEISHE